MGDGLVGSPAFDGLVFFDGAGGHGAGGDLDEGAGAAVAL